MNYAVLISGGGSYAKTLFLNLNLFKDHSFRLVICDSKKPGYLFFKNNTSIDTYYVDYINNDKHNAESLILRLLLEYKIDLIFLTFNRLLSPLIVKKFPKKIFNLHLSLLPSFIGFKSLESAYKSSILYYGSTFHIVDDSIDMGPIVGQLVLPRDINLTLNEFIHIHFLETSFFFVDMIYKSLNHKVIKDKTNHWRFKDCSYGNGYINPYPEIERSKFKFLVE